MPGRRSLDTTACQEIESTQDISAAPIHDGDERDKPVVQVHKCRRLLLVGQPHEPHGHFFPCNFPYGSTTVIRASIRASWCSVPCHVPREWPCGYFPVG